MSLSPADCLQVFCSRCTLLPSVRRTFWDAVVLANVLAERLGDPAISRCSLIRHKWFANLINLRERAPYGIKDERIRRIVLGSLHCNGQPMVDTLWRRGGTILEFRWLAKVVEKELEQIEQPALIFHPRFDDQSDISNAILLLRKLGGLVEVVVLNDSYHLVTVDRQRADVADRSVTFSARLARQHKQQKEIMRLKRGAAKSI
jgi:carboxylesterase